MSRACPMARTSYLLREQLGDRDLVWVWCNGWLVDGDNFERAAGSLSPHPFKAEMPHLSSILLRLSFPTC